jgi:hypothetical protein
MNELLKRIRLRAENEQTRTDNCDLVVPKIGSKYCYREVDEIELRISRELPASLKQIYVEVGNGGFGPGYGFMSLEDKNDTNQETVLGIYHSFCSEDPEDVLWKWPKELIPIIDWGCAIRSCINCDNGKISIFDPNFEVEKMDDYFIPQGDSLESFMLKWCEGVNLWEEVYGA